MYGDDVEVDYRGYEVGGAMGWSRASFGRFLNENLQVTVENLIRVLTGL